MRKATLSPKRFSRGRPHPEPKPQNIRPLMVAIVGGSGSGKSWLAKGLAKRIPGKALRISLDDFYRDRSDLAPELRAKLNFDNPRAIDWPLFHQAMKALRQGRPTRLPAYDFPTHCRRPQWRAVPKPAQVILVEGLWLLHSRALRDGFDVAIFLDCCGKTRLARRLERDVQSRGRTRKSVLQQF